MPSKASHPILSAGSRARLAWVFLRHPRTGLLFLRVLKTTWMRFFLPQYGPWRSGKVRKVSMELDSAFAFDASWYPCYMGFTHLWTGSLGWLHGRFGRRALPDIQAFLTGLESLFVEAHKVYAACQSTAASGPLVRPKGTPLAIRIFDPNLHCFPSTHVMIVGYNAWRLAEILDRFKGQGEDFEAEKALLMHEASRVVESIIHVKQHSLGDIAPALLLLGAMGYGPRREEALEFLEGLFPHLPAEQGAAVRAFLKSTYERMEERRQAGEQAVPVLLSFLEDYDREIAAILAAAGVPAEA